MEPGLLLIAILALLLSGCCVAAWLVPPKRSETCLELLVLAWLLGCALLPPLAMLCRALLPGSELSQRTGLAAVASVGGIYSLACWFKRRRRSLEPETPAAKSPAVRWIPVVVFVVLMAGVFWLSQQRTLGWDGLLKWEFKARVAFLNGGVLPLDYWTDLTRSGGSTHPEYPLFLPLVELWIYRWIGAPDQQLLKALFPLFFACSALVLYATYRRYVSRYWHALLPVVVLAATPQVLVDDGSATSGFADFPLATYYVAAGAYLLRFRDTGEARNLLIAGLLASLLPWIKQEGIILWLCTLLVAIYVAARRRQWRMTMVFGGGALVFLAWRWFLQALGTPVLGDFLPLSPATLLSNIDRVPIVAKSVVYEALKLRDWGPVLPLFLAFMVAFKVRRIQHIVPLALLVLVPCAIDASLYVFSSYANYLSHLETSLSRLWLQLLPMALLLVVAVDRMPACCNATITRTRNTMDCHTL